MIRNWDRLTVFVQDRRIPLDNNPAERCLRTPVVGRKNFHGSRAVWAAELAAMIWSLAETARQHGQNPLAVFTRYLEACAIAGGAPLADPALAPFRFWEAAASEPLEGAKEDTS